MYYIGAAPEKGTFVVTFSFTDSAQNPVTPISAKWTLTDRAGTIINGRSEVVISALAPTVSITLSNLDLASYGTDALRVITVEYVFTSTEGSNLPMAGEALFSIADLRKIT
jgi:hypothetical protein